MTTTAVVPSLDDHNGWADYWRYKIGVNVIPADSRNKRPLVIWSEWQHNPIPEELHKQWKSENLFLKGVAIVLGKVWHRKDKAGYYLACIDTDNKIATGEMSISAKRTLVELHKDRPDKSHSYIYSPRPVRKKSSNISPTNPELATKLSSNEIPAVEVKCEGSIMYCTPGFHKNGYRYEFVGQEEPMTLTLDQANEFENYIDDTCRKYCLTYLGERNGNKSHQTPIEELFKPGAQILEGHNRHEALLRVMESLIARNARILSVERIRNLAKEWNELHCLPPLADGEFERQWKDATRFIASKDGHDRNGINKNEQQVEKEEEDNRIQWLTHEIMQKYVFKTMRDNDDVYYYNPERGLYVTGGERLIKELCELLDSDTSTFERQEVLNHIRLKTGVDRAQFDSDPNVLNLKNGLLNVLTDEFRGHSADELSRVQLPIKYDPKAKCPRIEKFLQDVLPSEDDCFTAIEYIAYCFYKTAKYQKALMCVGTGANGKGTFLKLIERFVGSENTSNRSLQDICDNRFAKADLYGKLVNVFADLKADKLTRTGDFKMLVAGDSITGEHKFKNPFVFRNHAKLIFSANQIPESEDKTFAYFRRWIILFFYSVFAGANDEVNLIDELTTDEELSGLLNLALMALKQLITDNGFIKADDVEKVEKEVLRLHEYPSVCRPSR